MMKTKKTKKQAKENLKKVDPAVIEKAKEDRQKIVKGDQTVKK